MILTYTSNRFVLSSFSYRSVQILTDLKSVNIGSVHLCVIVIKKNLNVCIPYMCMSVADVYVFECIENGLSLFCGSKFYELCQMGKYERKKTTLNVKIVCFFCLCHTTAT